MKKEKIRNGKNKGSYIFTVKSHPNKGIMSAILGIISIAAIVSAVYLAYQNNAGATPEYGAAVLLAAIFSLVGLVMGILSRMEKDKFYLFPYLGIGFNFAALAMVSMILYAGAAA